MSTNGTSHRIRSISVIGGFLDGIRLDLADGLNCVIGARGTGKTTALELVRYAIDALPSREANPIEHRRIESLVQQNLAGGRVEVKVETKDGLQYTITRSWGEDPIVLTAEGRATAIALAGSGIFKADIYSQNEVEGIADHATSQLALIDNFENEAIAQLDADVKQVLSMLSANAAQIMPLRDKLAALGIGFVGELFEHFLQPLLRSSAARLAVHPIGGIITNITVVKFNDLDDGGRIQRMHEPGDFRGVPSPGFVVIG